MDSSHHLIYLNHLAATEGNFLVESHMISVDSIKNKNQKQNKTNDFRVVSLEENPNSRRIIPHSVLVAAKISLTPNIMASKVE